MIYHLSVSGTPVSWSITAVYCSSYGIARAAAETWHEKQNTSQIVIEIKNGEVERKDIFWTDEDRQTNDDFPIHLNTFRGLSLDEKEIETLQAALKDILVEVGYLIPREEWERRYPASHLVSKRFAEFNAACNALDREAGERLAFEEKWIPFMEVPDNFIAAYKVSPDGKGYGIEPQREGLHDPTDGRNWREITDAEAACRLLNSGRNWEETKVLLTPEPVGK